MDGSTNKSPSPTCFAQLETRKADYSLTESFRLCVCVWGGGEGGGKGEGRGGEGRGGEGRGGEGLPLPDPSPMPTLHDSISDIQNILFPSLRNVMRCLF